MVILDLKQRRKQEEGLLVKQAYSDTYKLYVKYHARDMSDQDFVEFLEEYADMVKRHNRAAVYRRLLLTVLEQLEKENS